MAPLRGFLVTIYAAIATVLATPTLRATTGSPTVTLDEGEFIGITANGADIFLGIPFAKPPVGDLRFRHPQLLDPYAGTHNATAFGLSCPQQASAVEIPSGFPQQTVEYLKLTGTGIPATSPDGEDCLTLNVVAPANAEPGSNLPVVVWFFGGGFQFGSPASYDGSVIVNRSLELQQPVVYVSVNYRVAAFGFIASQEVKDAGVGNLGLWDQRWALHWIHKYIHRFGGDPSKVTLWGQSSGAISVSLQMLAHGGNTEGLFRAAFMHSGSPIPVGDITLGQSSYDFLVERTNCSGSPDTLECLRAAPYDELKAAMLSTPSLYSYSVRALLPTARQSFDGDFLVDDPQKLVQQGKVARIPLVTGDVDDEGTLFSLAQLNVTTEAELRAYLKEFFFPDETDDQMDKLLELYPPNITEGSPYDTGTQNAITPEFKRMASIIGDRAFQSPRRYFLSVLSDKQNTWSYLSKRYKALPVLGALHATDLVNIYGGGDLANFVINFATKLNPNGGLSQEWPQYTTTSPQLMTFLDPGTNRTITLDTFRAEGIEFMTNLTLMYQR